MIKTKIIVVDPTKAPFLKQGEAFYLDRLRRYTRIQWVEVKATKIRKGSPADVIRAREGNSIAKKFRPRDYIIALDRKGKMYDSKGLSSMVERLSLTGNQLTFVIGGPLGLSKEILGRADNILSFSRLTLTHEMTRVFLLEQIYRVFTIINHEKYHK